MFRRATKLVHGTVLALAFGLGTAACGEKKEEAPAEPVTEEPEATEEVAEAEATEAEGPGEVPEAEALPVAEDYTEQAAEAVTEKNYKKELDKLAAQIGE